VAVVATVLVAFNVKPDYTMTSYVQFIPANVAPTDNAVNASLRNPWNQLGLSTLGQASIYVTRDQRFLDSLKDSGQTDTFTLTMTNPNPIVTVEVVGPTGADVRETTDLVIARLRASAQTLQKQSGAQDKDMILTQRLDQGQNLVLSNGKVKRALAAVAAAGLLLAAGGTVGFDALARRRSRRREAAELAELAEQVEPSPPESAAAEASVDLPAPAAPKVPLDRVAIVMQRTAKVVKHSKAVGSTHPPEAATYRSVNARNETNGDDHDAATSIVEGTAASEELRIVLQPQRAGGESGGDSH
jgi:hypothetical protein